MREIKQALGSKDCLACTAAMATETTIEEYKKFVEDHQLDPYSDEAFVKYLFNCGYMAEMAFDPAPISFEKARNINPLGTPCMVGVKSFNKSLSEQNISHAVYWDGKKICDPLLSIVAPEPGAYEIICIIPIVKQADHPRWKDEGT